MPNRFDPFWTAESKTAHADALKQVQDRVDAVSKLEGEVADAGLDVSDLQAKLAIERRGESVILEEATKTAEEAKFLDSQTVFYGDGIRSTERLYAICLDELKRLEQSAEDMRLERLRRNASVGTGEQVKLAILKEHEAVKAELEDVTRQWQAVDGELQLFLEKQRNLTNPFFGAIQTDYDALREWRKYRYFSEMADDLRKQLATQGVTVRPYKNDRLYAAVLRHRVPLKGWVDFTKEQLVRTTQSDTGTPMDDDAETQQVFVVFSFLAERARRAELQTWPE